jgi:PmbA protein
MVKKGRLNSFLADTLYAKKVGIENTASSTRSQINMMPRIGIHNLYIEKGKASFKELIQELNNGLYVTDVMGLHTANSVTGDFSVGVNGFLIENGDIVHGVKQVTMAGNFHKILNNVIKVGSDIKFLRHSGSPSLLIKEIVVSG